MNKTIVVSIAMICATALIAYAMMIRHEERAHINLRADGGLFAWSYAVSIEGDGNATPEVIAQHTQNLKSTIDAYNNSRK